MIVILLTRETAASDICFEAIVRADAGVKLPSLELYLNASKAVSFLVYGVNDTSWSSETGKAQYNLILLDDRRELVWNYSSDSKTIFSIKGCHCFTEKVAKGSIDCHIHTLHSQELMNSTRIFVANVLFNLHR